MERTTDAKTVYQALEREFRPWECTEVFSVPMGLQYHNTDRIRKVFTATFISDEVMHQIEARGETDCLLFTHHPVSQKKDLKKDSPPITKELVERMKQSRISLFTYHIPLDRNSPWSPGTNLAKAVGLTPFEEFYWQNQVRMGLLCDSPFTTLSQLSDAVEQALGHPIKCYPYGGEALKDGKVALMAGGASNPDIYAELRKKGICAFLTGITTPQIPWVARNHQAARENGVSLVGGTHYSTEKFALIAMTRFFEGLGLECTFLPETPNFEEL